MCLSLILNLMAPPVAAGDTTPGGASDAYLLEDDVSGYLMEDGVSYYLLESAT